VREPKRIIDGPKLQSEGHLKQSNEIGIAFLEIPTAAVEGSSDADLSVRVEKLEAEIASLKHLIREIRQGGTIASDAVQLSRIEYYKYLINVLARLRLGRGKSADAEGPQLGHCSAPRVERAQT
jgi:hypothetical protein